MKKNILFIVVLALLTACSTANEQGPKSDSPKMMTAQAEQTTSDSKEIDFMGKDKFEIIGKIDTIVLAKWIDDGYTVYKLEDGELMEEIIANTVGEYEREIKELKEEYGDAISESDVPIDDHTESIDIFSKNILKDHPDKEDYIDKLYEANELIKDKDENLVNEKIKEAKELRIK